MQILGLDIGGANIKAATFDGDSCCLPFAIWKQPDQLGDCLRQLSILKKFTPDLIALTMTAELADCFPTKAEGVEFIVNSACEAFPNAIVRVWLTSGEFAAPSDAIELPELAAAANWHALATWAGRAVPTGPALLLDIGSTTTDLIPLFDGIPVPEGLTDFQRLQSSELLYTGVRRTPVCAIVASVPVPVESSSSESMTQLIPVAAELFATSLDVHLLNEDLSADPADLNTADGRPATMEHARCRLARMICCDVTEVDDQQLHQMADYIASRQLKQICQALQNRLNYLEKLKGAAVTENEIRILLSGSGDWLGERAVQQISEFQFHSVGSLSEMFVRNVSTCAAAFAVARLAAERCADDLLPTVSF